MNKTTPLNNIAPIKIPAGSLTTGYLFASLITVLVLYLFTKESGILIFGITILSLLGFAAAQDKTGKGNIDSDLAAVGWSSKNTASYIPTAPALGIIVLFLGSLIMEFTPERATLITGLDMTAALASVYPAAIIPNELALAVNMITNIFVVAPAEEILKALLIPFVAMTIFKNEILAYITGIIGWTLLHIPTYIAQGVPDSMYIVLLLLGTVTTIQYWITRSIIDCAITHFTYNIGVLSLGNSIDPAAFYLIALTFTALTYIWYKSTHQKPRTTRRAT